MDRLVSTELLNLFESWLGNCFSYAHGLVALTLVSALELREYCDSEWNNSAVVI